MNRLTLMVLAGLTLGLTGSTMAKNTPALPPRAELALPAVSPLGNYTPLARLPQSSPTQKALSQLQSAKSDEEKAAAKKELKSALEEEYDKYLDRCNSELKKMEEKLEKLRDQVQKRRDAKDELVELRLKTMENQINGLGWPQESGGAVRGFRSEFVPRDNNQGWHNPQGLQPVRPAFPGRGQDAPPTLWAPEDGDQSSNLRMKKLIRDKKITDEMMAQLPEDSKLKKLLTESRLRAMQAMSEPDSPILPEPKIRRPNAPAFDAIEIKPDDLPGVEDEQAELEFPLDEPKPDSTGKGGRLN